MMARVKKNDKVVILSGKDKGKEGTVIDLLNKSGKVIVKGIALLTHHKKAGKQGEVSGIIKEESPIDLAKVMPVCGSCKTACRVNNKVLENGKRARMCNNCKEIF